MSESNILSYEQVVDINLVLQRENNLLKQENIQLKESYKEFDNCVATVYSPNKSTYKELEEKLAGAEKLRKKDIDELWETRIDPLRFELEDVNKQLDLLRIENSNLSTRTKQLNEVIKNLNTMIDFAVGYISATQPHTDKHPMEVKKWLFEGLK